MDTAPQVIVVGAGPVGLTAALRLAQAGIAVLVLEKRPSLSAASLASTIHPPTIEILDALGVLDEVSHLGVAARRIQYRTPAGPFADFDMQQLAGETRYPYRLHLEQSHITPVMVARLNALPHAAVRFQAEVAGAAATPACVTVTLTDGETIAAPYLLAADGARSTVRQSLGIAFDGEDYASKILRVMTTDDLDRILPGIAPVTYVFNGTASLSFLRMADLWRIILRVPAEVTEVEAMDDDWVLARFRDVLPDSPHLPSVAGKDVYGASRRVASRMRQGRAYIIGDAAHVTSTRGGMNMNCGMHDAMALASAIIAGGPPAVDAASDARRQVALEQLIPRTHRNVSGGPEWTESLRQKARDPAASAAYLRTAAMLDML